jgi:hypothetical protein
MLATIRTRDICPLVYCQLSTFGIPLYNFFWNACIWQSAAFNIAVGFIMALEQQIYNRTTLCSELRGFTKAETGPFTRSLCFVWTTNYNMPSLLSQCSSVSIGTGYGLPGCDSRQRSTFLCFCTPRPTLGTTQSPIQWIGSSFPRGKLASSDEVKNLWSMFPFQNISSWPDF